VATIACGSNHPAVGTQPAVGALTWQANYQRYRYAWKTDSAWPAGCRQLILTLVSGEELRVNVRIMRLR
jgi:hypothetical protein